MFLLCEISADRAVSQTQNPAKDLKGLKPRGSDWSEAPPGGTGARSATTGAKRPRRRHWSAERDNRSESTKSDRQVRGGVDFSAADVDFNVDVISVGAAC